MKSLPVVLLIALALTSCSTTRALLDGQYRLAENKVQFEGKTELKQNDVSSYIKQPAGKWSPGLSIYNWANPESDRGLSNLFRKIGTPPVIFNPSLIDDSIENIKDHLEYLGFYDSGVRAVVDTARRKIAKVNYVVTPGHRYSIDSIAFHIPEGEFGDEFMADEANISVKVGNFLSEAALETESTRSASYFRNLGYYDFSNANYFFEADTLGDKNILHYSIKGHSRNESEENDQPIVKYTFGDISITHSKDLPFNEKILQKINILKPGQVYSENKVNVNYARFASLKVFNSVGVELEPQPDHTLDCVINLRDSKTQGVKFNIESSINSSSLIGISPQISYFHKNIFRGGERLTLDFSGNFQFRPGTDVRSTEVTGSVGLGLPRLLGLPYSVFKGPNISTTEIKATYGYQDRPEYKRNMAGISYGYSGQVFNNFYFQIFPIQVNYVAIRDVSESFQKELEKNPSLASSYESHLNAGLTSTLYYTTNPDLVPKTPYHYARLIVDLSGNLLSLFNKSMNQNEKGERLVLGVPYSQFVRGELSLGKTFRWGRDDNQALATRFLIGAGYAYGNSSAMPFEKKFFVGGASSMRGWQSRSLGPGFSKMSETFVIPSQSGDFKMELDVEYRFKMFWKLEGAMFAEAGNVWAYNEMNNFLASIAGDWGLGIRLNLDFILIRVDGGFKLYEPSRAAGERWLKPADWFKRDGYAVHLGVGYPF